MAAYVCVDVLPGGVCCGGGTLGDVQLVMNMAHDLLVVAAFGDVKT